MFSVAALGRHEACKLEAPRAVMSLSFTLNLFDLAPAFQLALAGLNLAQGDSRRAGWMPGTAAGRGQEIDGQDTRQEDGRHDRHDCKCAADGDFSLRSDRQIDTNTNHLTRTQARAHTRPIIRIVCTFELTMHYVRTTCRQGRSSSSIQERSPSSCDMPTATAYSEVCIFSNTLATPSDMPTATAMRSAFWR